MSEQGVGETGMIAQAAPRSSVGEQLRQEREMRGLSIDEIAQTLKLGYRQVEALESGNWQALPGATFIRGFVRNYARFLQLDVAPLMAQLDEVVAKPVDNLATRKTQPAALPSSAVGVSRRDRAVVFFGVLLVAAAMLAYFLMPADLSALRDSAQTLLDSFSEKAATPVAPSSPAQPEAPAAASEPVFPPGTTPQQVMYPQELTPAANSGPAAQAAQTEAPRTVAAPDATPVSPETPQLRFLFDKDSWIEVRDRNNKTVFSQRLGPGTEQAVSGEGPLSVVIGYAPGVRLFWRGQAVDLAPHSKGDVARLVLE